jgi:hypothetical protein
MPAASKLATVTFKTKVLLMGAIWPNEECFIGLPMLL